MGRFKKIRNIPVDYEPHLCVGALWTVTVSMNSDTRAGSKFPYLQPCSPNTAIITLKSLMIYSGVVRVEERESNGRIVNVLRHTFVADGGRYIVTNFDYVKPIT